MEHCVVNRDSNAITAANQQGIVHVPASMIGALLLGPGTNVTHHAMMLLGESGASTVWVGEHGVRYYAHGRPLARTTRLLQLQAEAVTDRTKRLAVARRMYEMRFPDDVATGLTLQELRGHEGARVRQAYRDASLKFGVDWDKRSYKVEDFSASDPANQALTAATACLYGVVHSVVAALGLSAGLGFVHTGKDCSFVYDVADLYKTSLAVPVAFHCAATDDLDDLPGVTRRAMRDAIHESKLLTRCVEDIHTILDAPGDPDDGYGWDVIDLWDDRQDVVPGGRSWG
ncbi:type I-E CRISPR-associated endonuclease Cas1e [Cutibacterium equinum]|uniref:CRISPR-associated endonuclease Cas1 n=1 Tax=Cutibacterium equinum TaxID=3016342 RepID=A0ABY7R1L8_9ACTN|nr:type I-E CRISPR-associated endonuclease Cas1e [Cutibacterium equinum]WCC81190.1 type I-E CRISPR-associated endonuclease Cas1e [Cutibacterium equinum]